MSVNTKYRALTPVYPLPQIVKKNQAGGGVAVKIEHAVYQSAKMFGRHFDEKDELYSHITRQSIDVLKVRLVYDFCGVPLLTSLFPGFIQGGCLERGVASDQGAQAGGCSCASRPSGRY